MEIRHTRRNKNVILQKGRNFFMAKLIWVYKSKHVIPFLDKTNDFFDEIHYVIIFEQL